ncbi:MAG TPA: alpha/beta fold hydrolase [Alphaproteobacteria bacterium]|nr:alpha/beta fold hydrolase [Alphaproteobacteria bacterium]
MHLGRFRLESGQILPEVTLAYETYGQLAADGRNAILIAHGYTNHHHAAGRTSAADAKPGWWEKLIGPGKAIDTTRFFVVSSNMLGSCYGSTGPASLNPETGRPYGPDFPAITMHDIVAAQRRLLERLGVTHLVAVAGPSMGGRQAFQWAVTYPDFVDGIVAVASSPKGVGKEDAVIALRQRLAADPNWNDGWYYERGGVLQALIDIRIETLKRYGVEAVLDGRYVDPDLREGHIRKMAESWARGFDAHSLVVLRHASVHFNAQQHFGAVTAKVLYVISRTDRLFPPSMGQRVMERLRAAGVDAVYVEIDSAYGHLASGREAEQWAPALQTFLARLIGE